MKLIKTILASIVATATISCSNPLEEQLLGDWELNKYEIVNLDSICNSRTEAAKIATSKAIELARHEIDSAKTNDERKELQEKAKQLQEQLQSYTAEALKQDYTEIADKQIGTMTINFQNNKLIQVKVAGADDQQAGTWRLQTDTIITLFDNQPAEILIVKEVSSSSLTLFSPALDDHSVDLVMKFSKK
ncbi:MAG: hypothetical protein K6F33_12240 [Bacteroidales bacterium]|nr:hypothetical protein [Bacteroidales bacterium]